MNLHIWNGTGVSAKRGTSKKAAAAILAALLLLAIYAHADNAERLSSRVEQLTKQLDLTPDQVEKVRHILGVDQDLAAIDQQRYAQDPAALRAATQKRKADTRKEIAAVLTPEQQEAYKNFHPPRAPGSRAAALAARLHLDADQTDQLEQILAASPFGQFREERGVNSGDRSALRERREEMRKAQAELDRQIEAILTNEQKKEYEKFKEKRRKEMEARREERRGHRGPGLRERGAGGG